MKANTDLREKMQVTRVYQWEVAREIGISEVHFSRMLRNELPQEEKLKINKAISSLQKR